MFDQTILTRAGVASRKLRSARTRDTELSASNLHSTTAHTLPISSATSSNIGETGRRALAPVARETLQERVYAELRRSLIHGVFDAGQILRIVELAETLQTSTMPVREALARLVSEQALEALPNRSVRVPVITRARLDDLARARSLIEEQMVALALPNLTKADFEELRRLTVACESAFRSNDADKAHKTSELNHAFHFYIYQAAGSAVLIPIVESLWLQSGPYVRAAAHIHDENRDIPAVHHHWSLIDALERGDRSGAMCALTDDITRSFNLIRGRLGNEEALAD
jgi:DNA-binding GntR family transcriptional regulator